MENLAKVNARLLLIWVGDQRRAYQNRHDRGPFFHWTLRKDIELAKEVGGKKPYYHHANALD